MARMIPPVFDETITVSPGERKLFRMLELSPETEGWVVLHSQRIARPKSKERGEADFVVMIPGLGVLVLEVKAHHHIARREGRWLFGGDASPGKDPFVQAEVAMRALKGSVDKGLQGSGRRVLFADAVVFTHVDQIPSVDEWKQRQVIDARSVTAEKLASALRRSLESAASELRHTHGLTGWTFDDDDIEGVLRVLRPEFDVTLSPAGRRAQLQDDLIRFTNEQFGALDATSLNHRVVFEGPAGTGKTLLAVEAAKRALDAGRRVLLTCHNAALADHLKSVLSDRLASGRLTVGTLHRVLMSLTGSEPPEHDEQAFFGRELPEAALEVLLEAREDAAARGFLFDTVIVDELQDLAQEPFLVLFPEFLTSEDGTLFAFGDLDNQAIFQHEDAEILRERIYDCLGKPAGYRLLTNCRNTPRVVSWVTGLVDVTPAYSGIRRPDDGADPELVVVPEEDQPAQLVKVLDSLLASGYRAEEDRGLVRSE